jgi:hypothetical protein
MIEGKKIAMVVAHPDDESLWAGGLPLRFKDREWTIICCSIPRPQYKPQRAEQFFSACDALGVQQLVLFNHVETELTVPFPWLDELQLDGFDTIVTHNSFGEYQHEHHIGVHDYIVEKYWGRKPLVFFGYGVPETSKSFSITLTDAELEGKWNALSCYPETIQMLVDRFFHGKKEAMRVERYIRG